MQFKYLEDTIELLEKFVARYGGEIIPCTSEEVEKLESMLPPTYRLPTAYKEFLLYGGKEIGQFYERGNRFDYKRASSYVQNERRAAISLLKQYEDNPHFSDDTYILTVYMSSFFNFFKLTEGENPPVYEWSEEEEVGVEAIEKAFDSFTDFIRGEVRIRHLLLIAPETRKKLETGNPPRGKQFWLPALDEYKKGIEYIRMMDYFGFLSYERIENTAATLGLDSYSYLEELSGWKARQVGDEVRFFPPSYKSPEEKALERKNQLESKKQELAKVEKIIANLQNRIKNLSGGKLTGGRSINFNNSSALRIKELEKDLRKQKVNKRKLEKEIIKFEENSN